MCSEFWFSAQWLPSGFLCPEQQWDASWPPAVLAVGPWDLYLAWWDSPSGTSAAYIHPTAARPGHLEQSGGQSNHDIKSSCPHPACLQHFESLQLIYYAHEHETQFKKILICLTLGFSLTCLFLVAWCAVCMFSLDTHLYRCAIFIHYLPYDFKA